MLHFLFFEVEREAADDFFDRLVTGAQLSGGDPVLHLRKRFFKEWRKPRPDRLRQPEVAHLTIVAFNHRRAGNEIRTLRARFSDPFPAILPRGAIERRRMGKGHFRHHPSKIDGVETMTIWDRTRSVVDSSPTPLTPNEVVARLDPPALRSTVNACLWRDAKEGRLKKVGRGLYASLDYPVGLGASGG